VTLTNRRLIPRLALKHAGIDGWFESRSASIDVRRFKPAPQVYHMVAEELDVPTSAICMVAARMGHDWAQSVGLLGSLIARRGTPLAVPGLPQPQAVAPDLPGVATQLIRLWRWSVRGKLHQRADDSGRYVIRLAPRASNVSAPPYSSARTLIAPHFGAP